MKSLYDFPEVYGLLDTRYWNVPVEDNAFIVLRSTNGQPAQLHSSATLWKHTFRLEIGLEEGYLIAQGLLSKSGSYGPETLTIGRKPRGRDETAEGNPREEVVYFDRDLSWDLQVQEMVRCIKSDVPVSDSSSLDAQRVMEIIDRVYRLATLSTAEATKIATTSVIDLGTKPCGGQRAVCVDD